MLPAEAEFQKEAKRYGYWRRVGRKSKYICMSNPTIRESSIELFSRELNNYRCVDNFLGTFIYVTAITACIVICFFGTFKY